MPPLDEMLEGEPIKLLLIGDSGSGKTGALASLVDAGYFIKVLDYDNGGRYIANFVKNKKMLKNVIIEPLTDVLKQAGSRMVPKSQPDAFSRGLNFLTEWTNDKERVSKTIIVIDSLSHMSKAAFRYIRWLGGRSALDPWQSDYGTAQELVEGVLATCFANETAQHIIVNAHIKIISAEGEPTRGLPMTIGKALSPNVGTYFNCTFGALTKGSGTTARHILRTRSEGVIELKCPYLGFPNEVPLETGLAEFFAAVQSPASEGGNVTPINKGKK